MVANCDHKKIDTNPMGKLIDYIAQQTEGEPFGSFKYGYEYTSRHPLLQCLDYNFMNLPDSRSQVQSVNKRCSYFYIFR
jgi:hypothetical protein